MKKQILSAAVLAASLVSFSSALAADSLTLYGKANIGLQYFKSGVAGESATTQAVNSPGTSSRFGFRGEEDVSPGLKTVFNFEQRWAAGNDYGVRHWYVGFDSASAGRFVLGQTWDPLYYVNAGYDSGAFDTLDDNQGVSNGRTRFIGVHYTSPDLSGLKLRFSFHPNADSNGGSGANTYQNPYYSLSGVYNKDKLTAGLGYSQAKSTAGDVKNIPATKTAQVILTVGYDFGVAKPYFLYDRSKVTPANGGNSITQDHFGVSSLFKFGGNQSVLASLSKLNRSKSGDSKGTKSGQTFGLEYAYSISKRTDLVVLAKQSNNKTYVGDTSTSVKPKTLQFGIMHNF